MPGPLLSAEEVAAQLGVTRDTAYSWIADKAMPAHKIGRLFQISAVDGLVRSGETGGK
jgi:excisionase family DNA binding protein